jgi:GNAT superfamily N-acetyltransferase
MMAGEGGEGGFEPLLDVLDRLDTIDVRLGGGWGVDVLVGRVTRRHHDVDLFVPVASLDAAATRFTDKDFAVVDTAPGWPPPLSRIVVESPDGLRVDLNGLAYRPDGHAVQSDGEGDVELFPAWAWTERLVCGRPVVCLTAEAQRFKHRGYPERSQDGDDLALLAGSAAAAEPACFDPTVRPLEDGEEDLAALVETGSDRLFGSAGIDISLLAAADAHDVASAVERTSAVLVAGRPPVGMARLELVDGHAHLGQLSVLPEYGRLGIGAALVEASVDWARRRGDGVLTLTTFADVPFNAPWYRRLGFRTVSDGLSLGPDLTRIVKEEQHLERLGTRVVMSIPTSPERESDDDGR